MQYYELYLDLPVIPPLTEARRTYVRIHPGSEPIPATDVFPIEGWLRAYALYRWQAHVFCPPGMQQEVFEATKKAFGEATPVPIRLNDKAWQLTRTEAEPLP